MRINKIHIFFILFMVSLLGFSQHTLRLTITGVESGKGLISAALYTDQDSFLEFDKVFKDVSESAIKGSTTLEIKGIPEGTYAIAVFHDENNNQKLDTNMFGIPKETVAFSHAKMKTFGPPSFDECAFKINSNTRLTIEID